VRRLVFLLLLAWLGPAALAGTRVTVQQLDQLLTTLHKQPDGKVAKQLFGLELTERASSLRLERWQADFPGKRTREALLALADASAFLDLPASEILPMDALDADEQDWTFSLAIECAANMNHELPNFVARRTTTHFSDRPPDALYPYLSDTEAYSSQADATPPISRALYLADKTVVLVTYRDGHEVKQSGAPEGGELDAQRIFELTTSGELGPFVGNVIGGTVDGQVSWGHWEQGASGPLAVLRYAVPQPMSHYIVQFGWSPGMSHWAWTEPQTPAYHGEIAVDPESGAILRLTLEAELKPPYQGFKYALVVEYGSVTIGDLTCICPIKGAALSRMAISSRLSLVAASSHSGTETQNSTNTRLVTFLNDTAFTEYHVLNSDTRKLPKKPTPAAPE
jgi:hypothetical protein